MKIQTETGRILGQRHINPEGHELDTCRVGRTNFVILKSAIDRHVNALVQRGAGERHDLSRQELDAINQGFADAIARACDEVFSGQN